MSKIQLNKNNTKSIFINRSDQNYSICIGIYGMIAFFTFFALLMTFYFFMKVTADIAFDNLKNYSALTSLLMMANSIMMCVVCAKAKKDKKPFIPKACSMINFVCTSAIALSLFVTLFILSPVYAIAKDPAHTVGSLYTYSNVFFNFVIPILSIVAYLCYAKQKPMKIVEILYALIPLVIYYIVYLALAYTHMTSEGGFQEGYDWYSLCKFGPWGVVGISLAIFGIYFGILLLLRKFNTKINVGSIFIKIFITCYIILLVILGLILIPKNEKVWESFKWFTNWSNWIYGVVAVITLVYLCLMYKRKINVMPAWVNKFKICGVTAVTLTAVTVICGFMPWMLANNNISGIYGLFEYRNLYYHCVVPFLAIGTYIAFEHNELKFKQTLYSLIAPFVYLVIYTIIAYVNAGSENHTYYDWYYFYNVLGPKASWLIPILGTLLTLGISSALWIANRKVIVDYEPMVAVKKPYFAQVRVKEPIPVTTDTKKIRVECDKIKEKRKLKKKTIIAICCGCGLPILVGVIVLGIALGVR